MFKINNKPVAIVLSIILFVGFIVSLFAITQSQNRFEPANMKVLEDTQQGNPDQVYTQLKNKKEKVHTGFFNPGFSAHK